MGGGLGPLFVVQGEADLQRHLIMVHAVIGNVTTNLLNLEPAQIPQRLGRARDSSADRIVNRLLRRADKLGYLVNMIRHDTSPEYEIASLSAGRVRRSPISAKLV